MTHIARAIGAVAVSLPGVYPDWQLRTRSTDRVDDSAHYRWRSESGDARLLQGVSIQSEGGLTDPHGEPPFKRYAPFRGHHDPLSTARRSRKDQRAAAPTPSR